MNNEITQLYTSFTTGFAIIAMAAYLAGAWACLSHHRLSPWLIIASVGFVGELLASALGQYAAFYALANLDHFYFFDLVADVVGMLSTVVLALGLAVALADLRHKLAVSMEPQNVRH